MSDKVLATMPVLQLRPEFQTQHMRATAIELSNRQNTGWTQRKAAAELLDITYPTGDVRRALDAVSATLAGKPIVMMGQRGSGKSHIMALVHHAFGSPEQIESWASSWGQKLQADKLKNLRLQRGFMPLSATLAIVTDTARYLGIPVGDGVKALLDAHSVSITGGTISLHDPHGVPLRNLGLGSARLLIAGLQRCAADNSSMVLVDELEYGLEKAKVAVGIERY
jgi:energy-coupling factor transporter ATP-binding protein EcfA2